MRRGVRSTLGHYDQIYPTLQKYILLRRSLVGQQDSNAVIKQSPPLDSEVKPMGDTTGDPKLSLESENTDTGEHVPSLGSHLFSVLTQRNAVPGATRELLRHLGWLMEEVVRGSQEKVGLAQAAYDSVRDSVLRSRLLSPLL